jgi:hypothetical protein
MARQLFLVGEGDGGATLFVLGMISGAAFARNFALVSVTGWWRWVRLPQISYS